MLVHEFVEAKYISAALAGGNNVEGISRLGHLHALKNAPNFPGITAGAKTLLEAQKQLKIDFV